MSKIQKVLSNTKTNLLVRTILKRGLANKDDGNAPPPQKKSIILPKALGATDDGYAFSKAARDWLTDSRYTKAVRNSG